MSRPTQPPPMSSIDRARLDQLLQVGSFRTSNSAGQVRTSSPAGQVDTAWRIYNSSSQIFRLQPQPQPLTQQPQPSLQQPRNHLPSLFNQQPQAPSASASSSSSHQHSRKRPSDGNGKVPDAADERAFKQPRCDSPRLSPRSYPATTTSAQNVATPLHSEPSPQEPEASRFNTLFTSSQRYGVPAYTSSGSGPPVGQSHPQPNYRYDTHSHTYDTSMPPPRTLRPILPPLQETSQCHRSGRVCEHPGRNSSVHRDVRYIGQFNVDAVPAFRGTPDANSLPSYRAASDAHSVQSSPSIGGLRHTQDWMDRDRISPNRFNRASLPSPDGSHRPSEDVRSVRLPSIRELPIPGWGSPYTSSQATPFGSVDSSPRSSTVFGWHLPSMEVPNTSPLNQQSTAPPPQPTLPSDSANVPSQSTRPSDPANLPSHTTLTSDSATLPSQPTSGSGASAAIPPSSPPATTGSATTGRATTSVSSSASARPDFRSMKTQERIRHRREILAEAIGQTSSPGQLAPIGNTTISCMFSSNRTCNVTKLDEHRSVILHFVGRNSKPAQCLKKRNFIGLTCRRHYQQLRYHGRNEARRAHRCPWPLVQAALLEYMWDQIEARLPPVRWVITFTQSALNEYVEERNRIQRWIAEHGEEPLPEIVVEDSQPQAQRRRDNLAWYRALYQSEWFERDFLSTNVVRGGERRYKTTQQCRDVLNALLDLMVDVRDGHGPAALNGVRELPDIQFLPCDQDLPIEVPAHEQYSE